MQHDNRVVAITGATAGVGRATAFTFAQAGYKVALIARGEEGLDTTRGELEQTGAQVLPVKADVSQADQIESAANQIEQMLGPIDVWINCAMLTVFSPVDRMTAEEYKKVTETTYLGYVHGTQSALKRMKSRDRGTIVQVGSALAYRSIPLQSAYCAAKAAIRALTDSLRSELLHDNSGVRVTMVQLPAHNTPQFDWARNKLGEKPQPVPPIYQPEVAARAIFEAAQRAPRESWVGRSTLMAIIGTALLPALLDQLMAKQAYEGQISGEPDSPMREDNLEHPVEGLHHRHGRFDEKAESRAMSIDQETVTMLVIGAVGVGVFAAVAGLRSLR